MTHNPGKSLEDALRRFQARDLGGAETICREVLQASPGDPRALQLLGVLRMMSGEAQEAISLFGKGLERSPQDIGLLENLGLALLLLGEDRQAESALRRAVELGATHGSVHMRLGMALGAQGRFQDAEVSLRMAAERSPADPDVHNNLGNALAAQGRDEQAMACYERVLALQSDHIDAHYNLGTLFQRQGRFEDAASSYEKVLALSAGHPDAHNNLGIVREHQERLPEAMAHYRQALAVNPRHSAALNNIGNLLRRERRFEEAAAQLEQVLVLDRDNLDARINLGNLRADQGRFQDARECFEQALRLNPKNFEAHHNLGLLFEREGRLAEALDCYRRGLALAPRRADAQVSLANVLRECGQLEEAASHYRQAIALEARHGAAWYHLGETRKLEGRLDEAIECYERALALEPGNFQALEALVHMRQNACDWSGIEALWERLRREAIPEDKGAVSPFSALSMPTSAAEQLGLARAWSARYFSVHPNERSTRGFNFPARVRHDRLRVGYLSWDYHKHATAYLIAELFELHDRNRFDVIAYSYGPDDGSAIRARIRGASDSFHDIAREPHLAAAQRIFQDAVDILVDLKGYTIGSRTQIIALRPAPVQVNWLGYPGTMGADCIDYIIADPFVIPEGAERFYAEKVVRLPDCYQVNDRRRAVSEHTPGREECGLPSQGLVLCCFNQSYKILPEMFSLWMRLMRAVPGSVLWLLETNRWAVENLRRAAAGAGIAPERLVFAPRKPVAEHLARYRLADLAIDTFPYSSHTTASDALWVACPLVTCAGETFASRVAGSVLRSAGVPELVTENFVQYERLVLELAGSPQRLRALRRRLENARSTSALFDTPAFVRNLEAAYEQMFDAWAKGA